MAVLVRFKRARAVPQRHTTTAMSDDGSCVTLIFYRINPKWWKEPALNLASAVAQMSNLTHCEISLGEVNTANYKLKLKTHRHSLDE